MKGGYVKLHRKILDNPITEKPVWAWLWVVLLLKANHQETKMIWNNNLIVIKEGQFITGRKELSKETKIPETTIERILEFLEKTGQIGQQKTTKYRLITIINWKDYQHSDNKRTTNGQQMDTNKNDKNDKNNIELPIWLNTKAWDAWVEHRKEKKKTLTPLSMKMQIKFLSDHKDDHVQIIKNSITNGWTGLFPLKKDQFMKRTPPRFIEPSTSKEDNDRRNLLIEQSEKLAGKFKI